MSMASGDKLIDIIVHRVYTTNLLEIKPKEKKTKKIRTEEENEKGKNRKIK